MYFPDATKNNDIQPVKTAEKHSSAATINGYKFQYWQRFIYWLCILILMFIILGFTYQICEKHHSITYISLKLEFNSPINANC